MLKGKVANKKEKIIIGEVLVSKYLDSYYDSKNIKDKILVCIRTDFSNLNLLPYFKAIITEYGGLLSHAAIVSRELGIPCIVGVQDVTKKLKTGDKVKINFETGEIQVNNK